MTAPNRLVTSGAPPMGGPQFVPSMVPFLALLPRRFWPMQKQFFTYTTPPTGGNSLFNVASTATASCQIQINADSDFCLMAVTGAMFTNGSANIIATPRALVQLQDGSTGQYLSDNTIPFVDLVGNAQNPFFLPYPRVLGMASTFTVSLVNQTGAAADAYIAFHGFKIFPQLQQDALPGGGAG